MLKLTDFGLFHFKAKHENGDVETREYHKSVYCFTYSLVLLLLSVLNEHFIYKVPLHTKTVMLITTWNNLTANLYL